MSDAFLGQIEIFPYSFAPLNWIECLGQLLPISRYTALFSLLGTQFGGDGRSTFGLPDLQGRVAVGQGVAPGGNTYSMGQQGGAEQVTVTVSSMPSHSHSLYATKTVGTTNAPAGTLLAKVTHGSGRDPSQGNIYAPPTAGVPLIPLSPGSLALAGGNQPHNNIQPSLGLRYCICLVGVFPQRS
jgi:microcystin-dependent protein